MLVVSESWRVVVQVEDDEDVGRRVGMSPSVIFQGRRNMVLVLKWCRNLQSQAVLVVVLMLGGCSFSHAEKLQVFTEPLAPLHYEIDSEIEGLATELVRLIFLEAGLEPAFEMYPWKRAYRKALATDNSFIYTINRTEEREPLFKWIGPILPKHVHLYRLKNRNDIEIATLEDAKKYTTSVILGHSLTQWLRAQGFRDGKELFVTPNKEVQIRFFLEGRCDLITGNEYTIYASLQGEGRTLEDVVPAVFISSGEYYIGANPSVSDEIVEKLQTANERIQQSGAVEKLVRKYLY
ncbi:MAG: ABC transporter substrate-binding protein [Desulfopila sp.]|jgi:polar amino acid transport system substrate-binding protein|nr:ABC transporter substrate-binding protein [Desulfopila sp.]